jgi:hypothetical protein
LFAHRFDHDSGEGHFRHQILHGTSEYGFAPVIFAPSKV